MKSQLTFFIEHQRQFERLSEQTIRNLKRQMLK